MTDQAPEPEKDRDLGQRIAGITYRILKWGKEHVPPGVRSVLGVLFMVGGVFGFLPILGFWMLPLGLAFIALDIPPMRRKIDAWMVSLLAKSEVRDETSATAEDKGQLPPA